MRTIKTSTTKTSTTRAYNSMLAQAVKSTASRKRNSAATRAAKADNKIAQSVLSNLPDDGPIIDQGNLAVALEPDFKPLFNSPAEDVQPPSTDDLFKLAALNQPDFYRVEDIKSIVRAVYTFNLELFGGTLPDALHVQPCQNVNFDMCFVPELMSDGRRHENALKVNTDALRSMRPDQVLAEIAHNCVHAWQKQNFAPAKPDQKFNNRNHNAEFLNKCRAIGLDVQLSEKSTYVVSVQRVLPDSPLDNCIRNLLADKWALHWTSEASEKKQAGRATRVKYICACADPIVVMGPKEMKHACRCEDCGQLLKPAKADQAGE